MPEVILTGDAGDELAKARAKKRETETNRCRQQLCDAYLELMGQLGEILDQHHEKYRTPPHIPLTALMACVMMGLDRYKVREPVDRMGMVNGCAKAAVGIIEEKQRVVDVLLGHAAEEDLLDDDGEARWGLREKH